MQDTEQTIDTAAETTQETAAPDYIGHATYSPEDNKIRLYPDARLDDDVYKRVKAAGFRWAPKQGLFVAPMWTPGREDLAIELCGELGDEDTTLTERASERAERFDDYQSKRLSDAEQARAAVEQIAGRFEHGQPILVGHHSERKARKDKERIENGMAKAVRMWDTSEYWKRRAAGVLFHAKYKERADVRARRIKKLESEQRKTLKHIKELETFATFYESPDAMTATLSDGRPKLPEVLQLYNSGLGDDARKALRDGTLSLEDARQRAAASKRRTITHYDRWGNHYANRIEYEKALLAESGGIASDRFDIVPGGEVLVGSEWCVVLRVNKSGGSITSLTTTRRYVGKVGIERVSDYRAPTPEKAAKVAAAMKKPPMLNYPGEGFKHMTKAEWASIYKDYKGSQVLGGPVPERKEHETPREKARREAAEKTAGIQRHRVRTYVRGFTGIEFVYLTDMKTKHPKQDAAPKPKPEPITPETPDPVRTTRKPLPAKDGDQGELFGAMREALKTGVQTVSAPQLFPTPDDLADKMASYLDIENGHTLLEPSAGTGALLSAVRRRMVAAVHTIIEMNCKLANRLRQDYDGVTQADFLQCGPELGTFDRVLMNPPFANGADIKHIEHARGMLKPGGRLVAICANGPRQRAAFMDVAEHWEDLPAGTFKEAGTNVNTALLVLTA